MTVYEYEFKCAVCEEEIDEGYKHPLHPCMVLCPSCFSTMKGTPIDISEPHMVS